MMGSFPSPTPTGYLETIDIERAPLSRHEPIVYQERRYDQSGSDKARLNGWKLFAVTLPNSGIQVLWLIVMSYGTPYMDSLGMPGWTTALVWLSGPLCGALVQPLFAMLSDRSQHRWGRRKPFIVGGASFVSLSLLCFASVEDITNWLSNSWPSHEHVYMSGLPSLKRSSQLLIIFWAVNFNIAIQALQCGVRALIVDTIPSQEQSRATAWSVRFTGIGALTIAGTASIDTTRYVSFLGETKMKVLCVLAVLFLAVSIIPLCIFVTDSPSTFRPKSLGADGSSLVKDFVAQVYDLPPLTARVCKIQFVAWMSWFPVLYYNTTFVYQAFVHEQHVHLDPEIFGSADPRLIEMGKQAGTHASLVFACTTLVTAMALLVIANRLTRKDWPMDEGFYKTPSNNGTSSQSTQSIQRLWQISNILLASLLFLSSFVRTVWAATTIVGALGVSWGITCWAPYALVSIEAAHLKDTTGFAPRKSAGLKTADDQRQESNNNKSERTAAILSIYNMTISIPQVLSALMCSGIFSLTQTPAGDQTVGWAWKVAGIFAVVAVKMNMK